MELDRFCPMLLCSDIHAAADFYVRHLGMTVNARLDWFVGLERPLGGRKLEIALCAAGHPSVPEPLRRPTDGLVLALVVPDADSALQAFADAGVEILAEMKDEPWGQRHFYAAAPDGVAIDVVQPIQPDPAWMQAHGFA